MTAHEQALITHAHHCITVQFHVPAWDDPAQFAADFRACEAIYGRTPTDIDVDRAYARYKKLATEEAL